MSRRRALLVGSLGVAWIAVAVMLPLLRCYGVIGLHWWLCFFPGGIVVGALVALSFFEVVIGGAVLSSMELPERRRR